MRKHTKRYLIICRHTELRVHHMSRLVQEAYMIYSAQLICVPPPWKVKNRKMYSGGLRSLLSTPNKLIFRFPV